MRIRAQFTNASGDAKMCTVNAKTCLDEAKALAERETTARLYAPDADARDRSGAPCGYVVWFWKATDAGRLA